LVQRPNEGQRESSKIVQSPKIEQESLCNQQSKLTVVPNEEHDADSSWPVGTESWYVHEIKPQRTLCLVQQKQCVSQQDYILADRTQHISDTEDGATSDSFWPLGNESWFIHEIKPQRESLAWKSCTETLRISQSLPNKDKPHHLEDLLEFAANDGCGYTETQAVKLDDQSQVDMKQRLNQLDTAKITAYVSDGPSQDLNATTSIDNPNSKFKQKWEMISVRHTLKESQDRKKLIQVVKLHDLLLRSDPSERMTTQDCSNNRLLRRLGKAVALLFFFLFSMINRIEVLPDSSHSKTNDHRQRSIVESQLLVNTTPPTSSKRYLERAISYAKTIEILRNLESLLIYAIA
jgi:hypothetical protein